MGLSGTFQVLGFSRHEFEPWLHHVLALRPWASPFLSPSLYLPGFKQRKDGPCLIGMDERVNAME